MILKLLSFFPPILSSLASSPNVLVFLTPFWWVWSSPSAMWVVEPNSATCLSAALPVKRHCQESRLVVGPGVQGIIMPSHNQGLLNDSTHEAPGYMAKYFDSEVLDLLVDSTVVETNHGMHLASCLLSHLTLPIPSVLFPFPA